MIESVKIDGYRLLDDFTADLGRLTVVIGANATGKSSLLDCLQLMTWAVAFPLDDAISLSGGMDSILSAGRATDELHWKLVFRKPTDNPIWNASPLDPQMSYVYEVKIKRATFAGQPIPVYELLSTKEPYSGYDAPLKFMEATPGRTMIYDPQDRKLVPFDQTADKAPMLFPTENKGPLTPEEAKTPEKVSEESRNLNLSKMRFYNEYPIPSWSRTLLSSLMFYTGFHVGSGSKLRSEAAEIKPVVSLSKDGDNLGTVLHEMFTRASYRSSAETLKDLLKVAYPSFDDIFTESTFGAPPRVVVRVKETGLHKLMELWDLSDGLLRFLCLATALLNPSPPPFVAIDEPEVGLHPKLLPIVGDIIKMASEKTQVLVTTHSPELLNCFDLDDVAVMVRDDNKVSWNRPSSRDSLRVMLANVTGDSLGDLHRSGELEEF